MLSMCGFHLQKMVVSFQANRAALGRKNFCQSTLFCIVTFLGDCKGFFRRSLLSFSCENGFVFNEIREVLGLTSS